MNKDEMGHVKQCSPAVPFIETENPDIELYLRSVWWYSRLRKRNDLLVLEIRNIPRRTNNLIKEEWDKIKKILL